METGDKTILLVEDEIIISMLEKQQLEGLGYRVLTVISGELAIEAVCVKKEPVDLILMDIDLGSGIDGIETARRILSAGDYPLVFFSSHTEKAIVDKTETITNYGYVAKNTSSTILDASIKMAFKLFDARRQIESSEHRYKSLFQNLNNSSSLYEVLYDPDGRPCDYRYLTVNPLYEKSIGYTEDFLAGKTMLEVFPRTEAFWLDAFRDVVMTGTPTRIENYSRELDRYFEMTVYVPQIGQLAMIGNDITSRKQNELAISIERERLSVTLRSIGDGVLSTDIEGRVQLLNRVAENMTGWTQAEAKGQPLEAVFHIVDENSLEPCENPVQKVLREGTVVELANHTMLISRDNRRMIIADSAAPILDCDSKVIGVVLVFRDITSLKEIEENARESEAKYRMIIQASKDGVWVVGLDRRFRTVNPAYCAMSGYTEEDFASLYIDDIDAEDDKDVVTERMKRIAASGSETFETRHRRKDGSLFDVEISSTYLARNGGIFISFIRDISGRKAVENSLRKERSVMEMVMETSPVGIATVSASGQITYANRMAESILGLTRDSITSRDYNAPAWNSTDLEGKPLADEAQPFMLVKQHLQPVHDIRHAIAWPDGRRVVLSVNACPFLDEFGRFAGMVATMEDITERQAAEARIHQLLQEKELILREVHHRIKNNLNTVYGLLSLQSFAVKEGESKRVLDDSSSRVRSMIVLYEKLYLSENVQLVSLKEYVPALISQIVGLFPRKDIITVETDLEDILLDTKRLSALGVIFNELITNSMKYAFAGRTSGRIGIHSSRTKDSLSLTYSDDGVGIPDGVDFAHSGGFGMQLVKGLVQQLQGTIRIDRTDGTRIILELPLPH